nr:hypothetical protein [uncultured Rhizobium sp.]
MREDDRQGGDEKHQLAESIADQGAGDAIIDGPQQYARHLHQRDQDGQLEEAAKALFADQIEFRKRSDRLDDEQPAGDQRHGRRRRGPVKALRGQEEGGIERQQRESGIERRGDEDGGKALAAVLAISLGLQLRHHLEQHDAGAELGDRGAGHHQPQRKRDNAIGFGTQKPRGDDGRRKARDQQHEASQRIDDRICNDTVCHSHTHHVCLGRHRDANPARARP